MGFLDWLLGKSQEDKIQLKLGEIDSYILSNITIKSSSINKKIEQSYQKIAREIEAIRSNLNILATVEIKDNVPEKAKIRVLGNRDAYIHTLRNFLQTIHVPDVIDQEIALNFCSNLNQDLTKFSESTKKNFYIVEQLLGIELDKVTKNLRIIISTINSLKEELEKEDVIVLKNLRQRITNLREKRARLTDIDAKIKDLESKMHPFLKAKSEIEESITNMKQGHEYEIYWKFTKEKLSTERKMKELEQDFQEVFSQISKAVKKYNKTKRIKILDNYLESPFEALTQDASLELLNHLKDIETQLNSDELQIKGKAKEKIARSLSLLSHQYLSNVLARLSELKSQYMSIKSKLFSSRLAEEEMHLSARLDSVISNLKLYESELLQTKKMKEKLNLEEDKRIISNLLTKLTNKELSILLD